MQPRKKQKRKKSINKYSILEKIDQDSKLLHIFTLARKIRAAQWTYWYGRGNAWSAAASMLRDLRA
jgi:hypothetical protein